MRRLEHILIFIAVRTLYLMFELLPLRAASALGGWIGRNFGPLFPISNVARKNLVRVMPERAREHSKIICEMWDNLGRVFAEYPHLKTLAAGRGGAQIDIIGAENFDALREMGRGGFVVTGHLANWEFGPYLSAARGVPVHVVYRPPNNPLVDRLLIHARAGGVRSSIAKGGQGAKDLIRYLKSKEYIAVLIDQKMNNGIEVPFLGAPAMTAAAVAQLAIKYQMPICMIRPERISGLHFRWTALPPFIPTPDAEPANIMARLNDQLGEWVRERPGQWLWIHRRWGK